MEIVDSYKYYNLDKPTENKDTIPQWMEKVLEEPKEKKYVVTDFTGIYP